MTAILQIVCFRNSDVFLSQLQVGRGVLIQYTGSMLFCCSLSVYLLCFILSYNHPDTVGEAADDINVCSTQISEQDPQDQDSRQAAIGLL